MKGILLALDANVFIYAAEGNPEFGPISLKLLKSVEAGELTACASELCFLEVLAGEGLTVDASHKIEQMLTLSGTAFQPVNRDVLLRAARLRREGLRTPDAIHVASALQSGATHFVTNDAALRRKSVAGLSFTTIAQARKLIQ